MIKLEPHQPCPFGSFCGYKLQDEGDGLQSECYGLDPGRGSIFICELWAECYEEEIKVNA
ncbi:MAG: hypothetical protein ACXADW_13990 [Candidatus Hodarchaeales archaeon]|jgi:hypothetical protein